MSYRYISFYKYSYEMTYWGPINLNLWGGGAPPPNQTPGEMHVFYWPTNLYKTQTIAKMKYTVIQNLKKIDKN